MNNEMEVAGHRLSSNVKLRMSNEGSWLAELAFDTRNSTFELNLRPSTCDIVE
jgi:hypothetical protein